MPKDETPDPTAEEEYRPLRNGPDGGWFWAKARPERASIDVPTYCFVWQAGTTGEGYGSVKREGRAQNAHRVAFELVNGEIPSGKVLRHMCNSPICVRPSHLVVGTQTENAEDAKERRELARRYKEDIGEMITPEDEEAIRITLSRGLVTQTEIADFWGVSVETIRRIRDAAPK